MTEKAKSFEELLSEAPLASDSVTVVGALARTHDPAKFILALSSGQNVTLDTKVVKSFTRLGGAFGMVLVQLELDGKLVPKDLDMIRFGSPTLFEGTYPVKNLFSEGVHPPKIPPDDRINPYGIGAAGSVAPFALATAHQAPAEIRAALMHFYSGTNWTDTGPPDTPVTGSHDAGTPFWHDGLTGGSDQHTQY